MQIRIHSESLIAFITMPFLWTAFKSIHFDFTSINHIVKQTGHLSFSDPTGDQWSGTVNKVFSNDNPTSTRSSHCERIMFIQQAVRFTLHRAHWELTQAGDFTVTWFHMIQRCVQGWGWGKQLIEVMNCCVTEKFWRCLICISADRRASG